MMHRYTGNEKNLSGNVSSDRTIDEEYEVPSADTMPLKVQKKRPENELKR